MGKIVRTIAVIVLTQFALVSVAQAIGASAMSVTMALANAGAMDIADCDGCDPAAGDANSAASCEFVCTAPLLACINQMGALAVPLTSGFALPAMSAHRGLTGPPEPSPPRTLI